MFRSGILNWLVVVSVSVASAQSPPQSEAKFSGRAEEVSLDLVVRDKHGHPVRDLRPEEIEILDDGHPAKVRSLTLSGSLGTGTNAVGVAGQAPAAAQPVHADPLKQVHLVSLLFETLDANSSKIAREGAYELLKGITSPNTYMAVLRVGARIGVAQSFTNEREPLKKAIDSLTNPSKLDARSEIASMEEQLRHQVSNQSQYDQVSRGDVSGLSGVGQSPGDPMALGMTMLLLDVIETSQRVTRDMHARPALASLLGVIRTVAKLPGRKVIVYFSEGLPLSEGAADQFQSLIGEANRAGVTIYTVDATGLDPDAKTHDNDPFISASTGGLSNRGNANSSNNMSAIKRQIQTNDRVADAMRSNSQTALADIASETGGSFMANTNDLRRPMHKLVEDEETYYLAYYSPQIEGYDGHFRTISVKVDRPGVTVQTRSGYFALPPSVTPLRTFELPMLQALNDHSGQPDPALQSHAFEFSSNADTVAGELAVSVPLSHLQVKETAGEAVFHLHFSILALIRDATGNIAGQFSEDVPYQAASELKATSLAGSFPFVRSFAVHPGKYTLEVAVSDQNADKITATQSAFEFKSAARPAVSEPLLIARLDPEPAGANATADPLEYQGRKVTPALSARVRNDPGSTLPVFFVMYPDVKAMAKPALAMEVLHGGKLLANVPLALPESAAQQATPFVATVPTKSLNPGDYVIRVVFSQGEEKVERDLPFVVEGEIRTPVAAPAAHPNDEAPQARVNLDFASGAELVFAQAPANTPMSHDDQLRLIEGARQRALLYTDSLPNFTVRESTRREISKTGSGNWNPRDAFTELVRFSGGAEERKLVEWNGQKSDLDRSSLDGMMLNGEFGFLLGAVFKRQAQAQFTWEKSVFTGPNRCEVFAFHVDRAHSLYKLRTKEGRSVMLAAYDGEVFLDSNTFHIRRITLHTFDLPKDFPIRSTELRVDYDLWRSGQGDHLVPVNGVIQVQTSKRVFERNEVRFKDYRRLGSVSKLKFGVE
ncbi:MAG TPA: VWA domain-containing protein [Bryobacteraceae bacterium]